MLAVAEIGAFDLFTGDGLVSALQQCFVGFERVCQAVMRQHREVLDPICAANDGSLRVMAVALQKLFLIIDDLLKCRLPACHLAQLVDDITGRKYDLFAFFLKRLRCILEELQRATVI